MNSVRLMSGRPVHRLFTGHRGGGKTTELKRVKQRLESGPPGSRLFVSVLDADDTIDLDDVDPTDLVLAIVRQLIAVDLGDRLGEAYSLRGLADIVRQKGRTDEASAAYRRAAALFRQLTMSSEANEIEERITSLEPAPAVPLAD